MSIKTINTSPYDVSTNPRGFSFITPDDFTGSIAIGVYQGDTSSVGYVDPETAPGGNIPAGQVIATNNPVITDIDALTDVKIRLRRKKDPDNTSGAGWLPDVRAMRYTGSNNTGANDGSTVVTDISRLSDTQYITIIKINKTTNAIVEHVPITLTASFQITIAGQVSDYVDITINPKPNSGLEGELDRDSSYKYRLKITSSMPTRYLTTSVDVVNSDI